MIIAMRETVHAMCSDCKVLMAVYRDNHLCIFCDLAKLNTPQRSGVSAGMEGKVER